MALRCPRCAIFMTEQSATTAHGPPATVHVCGECRGLWMDAPVLAAVCPTVADLPARRMEILLVGEAGANLSACPRCAAVPYELSLMEDMLVDFCPQCCGVWLDGDEYEESLIEPVGATRAKEASPYRAAADKLERRAEVGCQGCSLPTVVAKSYVGEHGFLCRSCHFATEERARTRRVNEATGPLTSVLDGLFRMLAAPPRPRDPW